MEETDLAVSAWAEGLPNLGQCAGSPQERPHLRNLRVIGRTPRYARKLSFPGSSEPPWKGTDILYLHLLGKDTIVLCSNEAISDLIDKRSSIYADRVSDTDVSTFYP